MIILNNKIERKVKPQQVPCNYAKMNQKQQNNLKLKKNLRRYVKIE